jgi:hypothetical protein
MDEKLKQTQHPLIRVAKARGMQQAAGIMLDVLEPIAPIAAQLLWVAQPFAAMWGFRSAVRDLADILETPDGIESLRQQLDDEH